MEEKILDGRIAVVTGASRGIGYHAALALARAGAHVVAVARTVGGLEELDDEIRAGGGAATLVPVDLKDMPAIDRLGAKIFERWGRLDILLGNAGILGQLSPVGHVPPDVWNDVFTVNVTANWRLIRAVDPLLRQSDAGRAIFISSGAAHDGRPFFSAYSASKAALNALARTYAAEIEKTAIKVSIVEPGPINTALRSQALPGAKPDGVPHPRELAPHLLEMASPDFDRTGQVFDFPARTWREFRAPA